MAGFWASMANQSGVPDNQSIQTMKLLNKMAWGVEWLEGTIETEVYTVTRERLIQQGTTNYKTFDFETSQNLFFASADRQLEKINITNINQLNPNTQHTNNTQIFDPDNDTYTKQEIPQRMKHTYHVQFPHLNHNNIYRPVDISDVANVAYLIPGAQGQIQQSTATGNNWTINNQTQLLQEKATSNLTEITQNSVMQPRVSYPRIHYGQPLVEDETGIMKFRYKIRFSTELKLNFHINPDYRRATKDDSVFNRQLFDLPKSVGTAAPGGMLATCVCMPYEMQDH